VKYIESNLQRDGSSLKKFSEQLGETYIYIKVYIHKREIIEIKYTIKLGGKLKNLYGGREGKHSEAAGRLGKPVKLRYLSGSIIERRDRYGCPKFIRNQRGVLGGNLSKRRNRGVKRGVEVKLG
jgi:hypothetical protein